MRWRVATALALILCAGAAIVAQQDSDRPASARLLGVGSIPFFERPQRGTSTYWEEPESAESRAWAHLLRKLTPDDSAPRGRTGGAGGGSQWHFLRLPGQPFDVGFRPRNVSEDSADNSTDSAEVVVVGFYYIHPKAHKVGQPLCDSLGHCPRAMPPPYWVLRIPWRPVSRY